MFKKNLKSSQPSPFLLLALIVTFVLGFAPLAQAQPDRTAVRAILDKNGRKDDSVEDVAQFDGAGRVIVLNLNRRGIGGATIKEFPAEILQLTALRGLMLKGNDIKSLPMELGNMKSLVELNLAENTDLGSLPPSIGNLTNLAKLDARSCGLSDLPTGLGDLKRLEYLQLWNNSFTALPYCVTELESLRELYLNNNKLTSLPVDMKNLKKLTYIDVQRNYLCDLLPAVEAWLTARDRRYKDHQNCENVKHF